MKISWATYEEGKRKCMKIVRNKRESGAHNEKAE
jgi:hypothetical protein